MNPSLLLLISILARLYPGEGDSIAFMAGAGIDSSRIHVEKSPQNRWFAIVSEAEKAGQISRILAIALSDYPAHEGLLQVARDLTPTIPEPTYDLRYVIPPTPTAKAVDRIVGGTMTTAFPDCCAVGNYQGYFCSGTLIRPNVVISAKHCAELSNTHVFLGGNDLSVVGTGEICLVERRVLHPTADIMLLILSKPSIIVPRRIATTEQIDALAPSLCTLVGFGTIDFAGTIGYGVKRRVEVPITALLCSGSDDLADFGCLPGMEMVAGHRGLNRDSCHGDSGGPLYVQGSDGEYVLLGVTSRGAYQEEGCGNGGIYVRADKYADWIETSV